MDKKEKKEKTPAKTAKPKMSAKQVREMKEAIKKRVYELEENNNSYVFVYYSGNNWYKIGGKSALFYYHILAPKIKGYKPNLRPDGDFKYKFETGTISVREIEALKERMKQMGANEDTEFDTGNKLILAFKMPEKIDQKKMEKILGKKEAKRRELEDLLSVTNSDPALAALMRAAENEAFELVAKMNTLNREIIGKNIIDRNSELFMVYRRWAKERIGYKEGLDEMLDVIDDIAGYMLTVLEQGAGELERIARYTYKIEEIREAVLKRAKGMIKDLKQDQT